jgi:hypothetical protein
MTSVNRLDVLKIDGFARTDAGLLDVRGRLTRTGAFLYSDGAKEWREYRPPEEVFSEDALETLKGAPLTVGHPGKVTPENWSAFAKGHVRDDVKKDGKFVQATIRVADAATIKAIESGALKELSCGYTADVDEEPGEADGERYDAIQRNIRYNHVGLGAAGWGRAGPEVKLYTDGGGAIAHLDVAVDTMPLASPGMVMPSMGVSPQEVQANSPFQPNPPPGQEVQREDIGCACSPEERKIDPENPRACLTCGRMVGLPDGVPELPHAQSTDIGDPYGHPPMNSPEATPTRRDSKGRAKRGYPSRMATDTKVKVPLEKLDAEDQVEALAKKLAKTEAERDAALARADAAEAKVKLHEDGAQSRFDAAVKSRVEVLAKACSLMGSDFKHDGLSDDEIRRACLEKYRSGIKLDGKSSDYVQASFDLLTVDQAKSIADQNKITAGLSTDTKVEARSDSAATNMNKRAQDAWKGN